jgi:4-hydroxy-tetrahydrodipicolinate synthase
MLTEPLHFPTFFYYNGFFKRRPRMKGCFTALITPFQGNTVDYDGLRRLVSYQIQYGITGILAVGTTGESPTLGWDEHNQVVETVAKETKGRALCIAGTGSNNTKEALAATRHAVAAGADAVLLVDPYYNGPSSLEIRKEYIQPVAKANPNVQIIPYIIPGRTGAQLLPEDLAILSRQYNNIKTVKEATGNLENMKHTRTCCGPDFSILSGDDGMTAQMMTDSEIKASGAISVYSNVFPGAVSEMVRLLEAGDHAKAKALETAMAPLFELVTVKTTEETPLGPVVCKAKNPLGVKALMAILGMASAGCRQPLGKLTKAGLETLLNAARQVYANDASLFQPIEDFFNVNVEARLSDSKYGEGLCYDSYQ